MMHDETAAARGEARSPYRKPRLGTVRLEADQVLTTGCKTTGESRNSAVGDLCSELSGPCRLTVGS